MNRVIPWIAGLALVAGAACNTPEDQRRDAEKAKENVKRVEDDARKDVEEAKRKADEKVADARKKAADADADAKAKEASAYQAYSEKVGKRMTALDKDIADMKADLAKTEGKTKDDANASLRDIEMRRANVQKDIDAAKDKSGEELTKAEAKIDSTMDALEKDVSSAVAKVKAAARKT